MPTVIFSGFILPPDPEINAHGDLNWKDHNLEFSFTYEILKSRITVKCNAAAITEPDVHLMYAIAGTHMRGVVDALAFKTGLGLLTVFSECTLPGEDSSVPLQHGDSGLGSLCSASAQEVIDVLTKERRLMKPLKDLTDTLFDPVEASVNIQRAIEGLSHLLSHEQDDRPKRWENLRESLNISRDYIQFITDSSKHQRHGHTGPVSMKTVGDIQVRGWTIMNRFIQFRQRGNAPLSEPEFPLL